MKISHLIFGLVGFIILFYIGRFISILPFKIALVLIIGLIFSILTLINLETGLFLFIFVVPFTQQLTLGKFGHAPVDIGTDDVFIIFIVLSWLANLALRKRQAFLKTSLNWPIVSLFAVSVFSFTGAYKIFGPGTVTIGFLHLFKYFEYVMIYFIVIGTINDFQQIKKFISMFFIVTGFVAGIQSISMFIYGGRFSLSLPRLITPEYMVGVMRSIHAFESNAILGAYYAFFLSILLAVVLEKLVSETKVPLVLFVFLLSFALFNTFSRSAYLGITVSFLILAILKEKRLILIILLLLVFSPIYMQSAVLERITLTVQKVRPTITFDLSAAIRLAIWKKALPVILNNLIFGTGYWTARWAIKSEAHSQYVAILIETGIVGFSIFCWLIIRMFKNSILLMKRADTFFLKALGLGYIAGLSAVLVTCFFSETLEAFRMTGPLWFVTGLVTSANRLLSEKRERLNIIDGT